MITRDLTKVRRALAFQHMSKECPNLLATCGFAALIFGWLPIIAGVVTAFVWSLGLIELELKLVVRLCVGAVVSLIIGRVFIPKLTNLALLRYM